MEKKNLVNRVADKQDRRQNLIEITPLAADMKNEITDSAMEAVNLITKDIPSEELQIFIKVLSKMAENMDDNGNLLKLTSHGQTV